ncbi:redox-sensitive transcriptional activator SoxR [Swaminathania salitolerans]|uniref:Transcriptional regulator n=1 Tax=Swaminathania salitolerans TaxID=182838 RepID=A0A511BQ94_9PROT|nr:redox-sensitive transcriptional activator SoxR [Swaminathania salitolerans]GBQ15167.1 MerR family transcriptional regulator [Swaminathania salitolerans LMG 21291]GEL02013.1 transcriptional regulator [Swaminathania salitolerans]
MNRPASCLSIGEVSRRSGVAVSALHFYENKGLIASIRTNGNQRRFARDVLRRVALIRVSQKLGLPLAEIKVLLGRLPASGPVTPEDVKAMVASWTETLDARIRGLTGLRDHLDRCIGCGCLSRADCPLVNPEDRLAGEGDGAVILLREAGA